MATNIHLVKEAYDLLMSMSSVEPPPELRAQGYTTMSEAEDGWKFDKAADLLEAFLAQCSVCWACGETVNHATGHDCQAADD